MPVVGMERDAVVSVPCVADGLFVRGNRSGMLERAAGVVCFPFGVFVQRLQIYGAPCIAVFLGDGKPRAS